MLKSIVTAMLIMSLVGFAPAAASDNEILIRSAEELLTTEFKDGDYIRLADGFRSARGDYQSLTIPQAVTLDGNGKTWYGSITLDAKGDSVLKDISIFDTGEDAALSARGSLTIEGMVTVMSGCAVSVNALVLAEGAELTCESIMAYPGLACQTVTVNADATLYAESYEEESGVQVAGDALLEGGWLIGLGGDGVQGGDGVRVEGALEMRMDAVVQGAGGEGVGADATAGMGICAQTLLIEDEAYIDAYGGNANGEGIGGAGLYAEVLKGSGFLFANTMAGMPNPIALPGIKLNGSAIVIGRMEGDVSIDTRDPDSAGGGYGGYDYYGGDDGDGDGYDDYYGDDYYGDIYDDDYDDDYGDDYGNYGGIWDYFMELFGEMFGGNNRDTYHVPESERRIA